MKRAIYIVLIHVGVINFSMANEDYITMAPSAINESVSVNIDASSMSQAIGQLLEQGSDQNESIKFLKIEVEEGINDVQIKQNLKDAPISHILKLLTSKCACSFTLNEKGDGFVIYKIVTTGSQKKKYFLSERVIDNMRLVITSREALSKRLLEIGISLEVLEVNSQKRTVLVSGTNLNLRLFEMMVITSSL